MTKLKKECVAVLIGYIRKMVQFEVLALISYTWIPNWTGFVCGQISTETATHSF